MTPRKKHRRDRGAHSDQERLHRRDHPELSEIDAPFGVQRSIKDGDHAQDQQARGTNPQGCGRAGPRGVSHEPILILHR